MSTIASVSLDRPLEDIARDLGESFAEYGFAIVRDHGVPDDLIARAEEASRAFFALPEETKRSYKIEGIGGARGYTPFGQEQAKDAEVFDLKEFWHVGRDLPADHPLAQFMEPNVWPAEVPEYEATMRELYLALEASGRRVLSAIAIHLGEDPRFFDPAIEDGNSVLRLLRYPPLPEDAPDGAIRAAPHGDINAITMLLGAEEAGLELLTKKGEWLAVSPPAGALAVNIGDMLERLTNGRLRSTTHRVVNPRGDAVRRARYSMPFFLHFRPDYLIDPLPSCIAQGEEASAPEPILAHDFLMQRLREIKLA
ncbi:isopenicillin N synthase family oxygenase [Alteriqipengyuania sp. NZ-12B]|uniref:2-oxoglutarate-dependent ethylene/succinate-forming enzyme n=1 Tax=Alteriqipengyuania abyssalis TaxID=2860200 RepID=A0ABS7PDN7_9SPHN|nr:2-oxoglutarate and iron-dependent oxygenase domain-containing protein [Alteriqipengyuania abyssalis]MBY8337154.1 isopenicillin N synthase family oxygenase [Alteriqipengyuania abyssalis]